MCSNLVSLFFPFLGRTEGSTEETLKRSRNLCQVVSSRNDPIRSPLSSLGPETCSGGPQNSIKQGDVLYVHLLHISGARAAIAILLRMCVLNTGKDKEGARKSLLRVTMVMGLLRPEVRRHTGGHCLHFLLNRETQVADHSCEALSLCNLSLEGAVSLRFCRISLCIPQLGYFLQEKALRACAEAPWLGEPPKQDIVCFRLRLGLRNPCSQ